MVKLTPWINNSNILRAAFAQIIFSQKITKAQTINKKLLKKLVEKSCSFNVDEINK